MGGHDCSRPTPKSPTVQLEMGSVLAETHRVAEFCLPMHWYRLPGRSLTGLHRLQEDCLRVVSKHRQVFACSIVSTYVIMLHVVYLSPWTKYLRGFDVSEMSTYLI